MSTATTDNTGEKGVVIIPALSTKTRDAQLKLMENTPLYKFSLNPTKWGFRKNLWFFVIFIVLAVAYFFLFLCYQSVFSLVEVPSKALVESGKGWIPIIISVVVLYPFFGVQFVGIYIGYYWGPEEGVTMYTCSIFVAETLLYVLYLNCFSKRFKDFFDDPKRIYTNPDAVPAAAINWPSRYKLLLKVLGKEGFWRRLGKVIVMRLSIWSGGFTTIMIVTSEIRSWPWFWGTFLTSNTCAIYVWVGTFLRLYREPDYPFVIQQNGMFDRFNKSGGVVNGNHYLAALYVFVMLVASLFMAWWFCKRMKEVRKEVWLKTKNVELLDNTLMSGGSSRG